MPSLSFKRPFPALTPERATISMAEELIGGEARIVEMNAHINRRTRRKICLSHRAMVFIGVRIFPLARTTSTVFPSWDKGALSAGKEVTNMQLIGL